MVRREFRAGVGCCVVAAGGVRRVFAAALSGRGGSLPQQTEDVLRRIATPFQETGGLGSIVMQSIFLRDVEQRPACRRIVEGFYGKQLPATAYIAQPPCDGSLLAIEAWGVGSDGEEVEIQRGEGMVVARHGGCDWAYLAGVSAGTAGSVYEQSLRAFGSAEERLGGAGLRFDDVIRTWLYLGGINALEGETPRYHELNRARTEFYRDRKFAAGMVQPQSNERIFPASTGIGTGGDEVAIGCIALRTSRPDVSLVPLENQRQTSSCDYGRSYGAASPKFTRAMAVVAGECATTLISGTASITASETRHPDSVQRQTQQTLDNIEALIAPENFRRYGLPGLGATLGDIALARVYLKRPEDYAAAEAICRERLGELPIVYVAGDVCRPELLVEIEGVAFCGPGDVHSAGRRRRS
jgi:enamine deaminase RidA (YjgF/YER057c/UK114 family)